MSVGTIYAVVSCGALLHKQRLSEQGDEVTSGLTMAAVWDTKKFIEMNTTLCGWTL